MGKCMIGDIHFPNLALLSPQVQRSVSVTKFCCQYPLHRLPKNMKILLSALFVISLIGSCSRPSKQDAKASQRILVYHGDFYPSFMPSSKFDIAIRNGEGRIKLGVYHYIDTTEVISFADSATLTKDDINYFFTAVDSLPVLKMKSPEYPGGTDGITVYNNITLDTSRNEFKFWSPRRNRNPQEHKLVEAILGLSRRKFATLKQQEYFESLEQYFDFGLPCKIISNRPFEVRIYGCLSANEEQELNTFVHGLPIDKPILIDMTNFNGMGTMFYPLFKGLLKRNPDIVWVTSSKGEALKQVQEIGVPATRIVNRVADGRLLIARLSASR